MIMNAVEVKNVSKTFHEGKQSVYALKDIDLAIESGEIFSLLGPNGAGKTTLLNIMTGLVYPDSGSVRILGKDPAKNRDVLEKMNIITAFGRYSWVLRGEQILRFYAMAYGIPKNTMEKRIERLSAFFNIHGILKRKFGYMSTGERMRISFAKALINNPKLILLDEPTLGLDPDIAIKVRKEIKRINRKFGTTIVLTSHYMHEVEELADRILFINKGKIVDIGTPEGLKKKKFSDYELAISLRKIKDAAFLKKHGFSIKGNRISKSVKSDNVNTILAFLVKNKYEIVDIEIKKPTLEDYFVRMLE